MRAIVLSGGGGKGAYQVGVWQALRKLNIKYDIVTGTSIGSINGVLMVSNDFKKAYRLWSKINYSYVFNMDKKDTYFTKSGKKKITKNYAKGAVRGGLDNEALRNTLKENINFSKFYDSDINYGLVTVRFPSLKPVEITKDKLSENKLIDYLLASSSAFPAIKMTSIDNKNYIDGGYYDNMPINLAIKMGADDIIAVDLRAIGRTRKVSGTAKIKYIAPRNDLENFLVMEKYAAKRALRYGYNDCLKEYNELDGNKYTFKKGSIRRNYERIGDRFYFYYDKYLKKYKSKYEKLKPGIQKDMFLSIIEDLAKIYNIDDSIIYRTSYINVLIKKNFKKYNLNKKSKLTLKKLSKEVINKEMIYYIYNELDKKESRIINNLIMLFPKNFLCALYIKTINR